LVINVLYGFRSSVILIRNPNPAGWCLKLTTRLHLVPRLRMSGVIPPFSYTASWCRLRLKCDGTCAETIFRLSAQRTSPFKSEGELVQSTTGRRAVHISLQGLYCSCKLVFCSHVTLNGYPLHSPVSPSRLLPCVTVCQHISNAVYK
jgi:hypothetical protein